MMLVVALMLTAAPAISATEAGRYVEERIRVGGTAYRFLVWLPPGHDQARAWPAIVFLHGSGECGTDPEAPTRVGLGPRLLESPGRWPFVVAFPQKPLDVEEWEEREDLVLEAAAVLVRKWAVSPSRIALAGMSQGGHGVWAIGARHPGRWSCLVPVCGYGRGRTIGPRVARLPIWAFHGLKDDVVDPRETQEVVRWARERRESLGLDPQGIRMTLYPDANHGSWEPAFAEPGLPEWILAVPPVPAAGAARGKH